MDINLDRYRVFYFTARAGSFSRAAEELFISQPAVSQAIKNLEEELNGQLFFRTPRGVRLTSEGKVLYKYIEQAYELITAGEKKVSEIHNLENGEIRIGASDTLCKYYLLPFLQSFHEKYPGVQIRVTNRTSPETIRLLKTGKIDLGFINLPYQDEQLTIMEILKIRDCFITGDKYRRLAEEETSLSELSDYPLLLLEKGSNTRHFLDNYLASQGLSLTPQVELGSIDLLVAFARIGLGISYVVQDFIKEELAAGGIYQVRLTEEIPDRAIGIITLKGIPLTTAAQEFINYLSIA